MAKTRLFLLDIVFLGALMVYVLAGVPLTPFHGDESTLIHNTRDYAVQFIDRDLSMIMLNGNPAIDPMDQQLRLIDGRVHKYLGGLAWHLRGYTADDLNTPWLWGTDWDYNQREGHIPTPDLLVTVRYASALLMAAGVVVIFLIGKTAGGRPAAYAAALLYATNPALLLNGRRSMMEGSLMFFSLLTVLAGMWFVRWIIVGARPVVPESTQGMIDHASTNRHQVIGLSLFLGLAAGLAMSSKHTAIFTIAPVLAACLLVVVYKRRWAALGGLVAAGVIMSLVFYALNPTWWSDPVAAVREVLRLRTETLNTQLLYFPAYDSFGQKLEAFARHTLIGTPQYFEVSDWISYIGDQITAYERSGWMGFPVGAGGVGVTLQTALFIAGSVWIVRRKQIVIGIWTIGAVAAVLLLTPFEWQRYYLPAILPLVVVMGLGISFALFTLQQTSKHV